ncbi:MAG: CPBP family intramembrane metalloprotease [Clostridia bacterium]|jgi:membrane protease YdiL (CAAX protease family)|nr:type II CAAX endopeptidase family protein [Lachnospiraceae bacterium]NCB99130.1 CPBP family intramembrane metalloprotease [Clostridia bacterium]NCD02186.1 CPBP family intramembrane metalloprotease [Clostridia bacterium]
MEIKNNNFSTTKTIANILIYFVLFLAGELGSSLLFDLIFSVFKFSNVEYYYILRMLGSLIFTFFLFWIYTTKVLHREMKDFGITCDIKQWGVILSVLLPAFVVGIFLQLGEMRINSFSTVEIVLIIIASICIGLKSGILEEMLFRGFIMKLLENRWNRYIAIFVPSFLFSLVHIPSMENFTIGGVMLLIISGTLVGVMFSLVAYKGNSISNSAMMHGIWNFVLITDILHITTSAGAYGKPIFSLIIPSENILLTGGGFGIEASLVAIIGYLFVCSMTYRKK